MKRLLLFLLLLPTLALSQPIIRNAYTTNSTAAGDARVVGIFDDEITSAQSYNGTFVGNLSGATNLPASSLTGTVTRPVTNSVVSSAATISPDVYVVGLWGDGSTLYLGPNSSQARVKLTSTLLTSRAKLSYNSSSVDSTPMWQLGGASGNLRVENDAGGLTNITAWGGRFAGNILATNGISSYSTVTPEPISPTGWTNIWTTNNAVLYIDGTITGWIIYDRSGGALYTNAAALTHDTAHLQPGWGISISGTGITGRALPF